MEPALFVKKLLRDGYIEAKLRNDRISLRRFASKLNLAQSAISEIMNGERKVTKKMALRIMTGLKLEPSQIDMVLGSFENDGKTPTSLEGSFRDLGIDRFQVISEWYHYAILSLIETRKFRSDPSWIASRLGISPAEARDAIARLVKLEMVRVHPKSGRHLSSGKQFQIGRAHV